MEKLDLLVFGDTAMDYFYEVDRFPKINEASEVLKAHRFYGGMGANTAVVASVLGLKTGLVSVIGSDVEDYVKYMQNLGVGQYFNVVLGDTMKSMFFKSDGNQVSFFYKGVTEGLENLEPDRKFINNSACIYLARTYLKLQEKVAKLCKNKFVVYNPGYGVFKFEKIPPQFYRVLKKTKVFILNTHELDHLHELGFRMDFKQGPEVFIVTKGKDGCLLYTRNTNISISSYRTKVVDTSGAGDAFNAGFIAGYVKGHDFVEAAKIGNAAASFVIEKWGCQSNLPTWANVLERCHKIQ